MITLLMFSGGLDSTGVFYRLIQQKTKLYVHHMNLNNVENRSKAESFAVKKICDYMKELGDFSYSESSHNLPSVNNNFMFDSDLYNLMAGSISSSNPDIKYIALGLTKSDLSGAVSDRIQRGNKIFESFKSNAKKIYPLINMTKKEIYDYLPSGLRDLTWSCRRPIYEGENILECKKCKTCRSLNFPKQQ